MHAFRNRRDAGRELAQLLDAYLGDPDAVVLALPRGGVPVGYEIARRLGAPLDVLVVRKIGAPAHRELAVGAIATGGIRVVDERAIARLGISRGALAGVEARERAELERLERALRPGRPPLDLVGRIAILVDDGIATGATMIAAIDAVRARDPACVVVAVPVASRDVCDLLRGRADEVICAVSPSNVYAVGAWYQDFKQTSDAEATALLDEARGERAAASAPAR